MSLHSTGYPPAPAPLLPAAPLPAPDLLAQLPAPLPPQHQQDLATLLGNADPASHKLVIDVYMRKHYPDLWRAASEQARQMKAESSRPTAANEPRMISKERIDHELPFGPGTWHGGSDSKRAAAGESKELSWRPVHTKIETGLFQDPASIQVFFNELSRLKCSEHSCSSTPNVHLDCIGPFPNDAIEPFNYAILVDRDLRNLEPEAFQATGNRLHAASFLAPFPHMYSEPPRQREAVNVMASGKECEHITPYKPASCKALPDGDQVAQIDRFFAENRNSSKPGGVVFVDGDIIDRWGKESRLLRESGMTALAIRPDKTIYSVIGGMAGVMVLAILAFPAYYGREKLKQCPGGTARLLRAGWGLCKSAASALRALTLRAPPEPPSEAAAHPAQKNAPDDAEESSIVIEDSDSASDDLGEFSSSSISNSSISSSSSRADSSADRRSDDNGGAVR